MTVDGDSDEPPNLKDNLFSNAAEAPSSPPDLQCNIYIINKFLSFKNNNLFQKMIEKHY